MIIQKLVLKNFRQYKDAAIEFKEGLIGIIGKNGSGKSTLFDAILCALYGELPTIREHIRTSFVADNATVSVELTFEIDSNEYTVMREYRGRNLTAHATLQKNGVAIVTGANDVSRAIEKIIGMPKEAFMRSVFAAQGELRQISETKGAERRELIRKIMGLAMLDDILQMIRSDKNDKKRFIDGQQAMLLSSDEITAKKGKVKDLSLELSRIEKNLKDLHQQNEAIIHTFETKRKAFEKQQQLYKQYSTMQQKRTAAVATHEGCIKNINENKIKLEELARASKEAASLEGDVKQYSAIKKQKEALEEIRLRFTKKCELEKQYQELQTEITVKQQYIDEESKEIQNLKIIEKEIEEHTSKKLEAEKQLQEYRKKQNELLHTLGGIQKSIEERKKHIAHIQKLGKEAECPVCFRPLQEAYDDTIARLNAEIEQYQTREIEDINSTLAKIKTKIEDSEKSLQELDVHINERKQRIAQLKEKQKNIEKTKKEIQDKQSALQKMSQELAKLSNIHFNQDEYNAVVTSYKKLEEIHTIYIALQAKIKEIPVTEKRLIDLTQEKASLEKHIAELDAEIEALGYSEKEHQTVKKEYDEVIDKKDAIQKEISDASLAVANCKNAIANINDELLRDEQNRQRVGKARDELIVLQRLEAVMDEFRSAVLVRIKPVISQYASNLFNQLTQGRYQSITMDDDFNFLIMDDGKWYPLVRFSGGEVDLANLCLRIAISNAITDVSGSGAVGFMAFDEIFGSQDNDRRASIMNALYSLQEQYRQIFIISHIDDVKELFPAILHVQTSAGGSKAIWI